MLGKKVKDIVTGFTGIATAKCEYLSGCTQYKVDMKADKNGDSKFQWVDVDRLEIVGNGIKLKITINGGPAVNMPKSQHP